MPKRSTKRLRKRPNRKSVKRLNRKVAKKGKRRTYRRGKRLGELGLLARDHPEGVAAYILREAEVKRTRERDDSVYESVNQRLRDSRRVRTRPRTRSRSPSSTRSRRLF